MGGFWVDISTIPVLTSSPWVPYFMCSPSLQVGWVVGSARAQVGVGFAVAGWFRRFRPPPLRWSCSVSVGLRFSFSLPFEGLPALGRVHLCWCLLLPSSFAFPSSRPG